MLDFELRASASPYVERVWRARSRHGGPFTSIAAANLEIVVERGARAAVTVRGPESRASTAHCPPETAWLGIRLRVGTFLRYVSSDRIRDGRDIAIAVHDDAFIVANGVELALPRFDDAEAFVHGLVSAKVLGRDAWFDALVAGATATDLGASIRTIQRRFARVTGLSRRTLEQIERARFATHSLREGVGIADVVFEAGYVDQAHLGRGLRRYVGLTPAAVRQGDVQMSLLYKPEVRPWVQSAW